MTNDSQHRAAFQDTDSDSSIRISDAVVTVWRRKWWLVCCMGVSMLLGYAYLQRQDTVYQIKARLLVQEGRPSLQPSSRIRKDEEFLATQAEIVRSPAVVGRAIGSLGSSAPAEDSLGVASILGSLKVTPVIGTNVLSLGLKSGDKYEGVRTVDAIISKYRDYLREMDQTSRIESLRLLTERESELRSKLDGLRQEYYQLRADSPLMDQAYEVQKQMLQELGRSMAEARIRKIELEQRIAAVEDSPLGTLSKLAPRRGKLASNAGQDELLASVHAAPNQSPDAGRDKPVAASTAARPEIMSRSHLGFNETNDLAAIRKQLTDAYIHAQELTHRCGPDHPEYRAARAAILISEKRFEDSLVAAHANWEQQLSSLQIQELQLATLYNDENAKIRSLDLHQLEEQQALEAIARLQESYDSVHSELAQWEINSPVAGGQSAVTVTVLEPPSVTANLRLPASALLFVCALLGLAGGGGAILTLEQLAPKVVGSEPDQD